MKLFSTKRAKRQAVYILIFLVLLILTADLNARLNELFVAKNERDSVRSQVYSLWVTQQVLKTQAAYANSDQAVEEWARQDGRKIKPGDIPVVPLPAGGVIPTPQVTPTPVPTEYQNWEIWQSMLLGK